MLLFAYSLGKPKRTHPHQLSPFGPYLSYIIVRTPEHPRKQRLHVHSYFEAAASGGPKGYGLYEFNLATLIIAPDVAPS
jgi:hypothetical protein